MAISTLTSKGQTTIPKEVREALDLEPGAKLSWDIRGSTVEVTTKRPAFFRWEGFIRAGSGNAVRDIEAARKQRGRI